MNLQFLAKASLLISLIYLTGCATKSNHYLSNIKTPEEIKETVNKTDKIYHMLSGHFSNKTQAATATEAMHKEQEVICVPIWIDKRKQEHWLYLGLFQADYPDEAIAQSIVELVRVNRDSFALAFYDIPNEDRYSKEWLVKEKPFEDLAPKDLLSNNCVFYAVERAPNEFEVLKGNSPCKKRFTGDVRSFKFAASLTPEFQIYHHNFFDGEGNLIMSYEKPNGLNLERLKEPKYLESEEDE
ncbi:MAG: hypothetical protein GY810_31970 [Aureispira sp.]|nr:hypothetical protein [Aureispira sp.]